MVSGRNVSYSSISMVNYSVFSGTRKRTSLPWTICSVNIPSSTFRIFFCYEHVATEGVLLRKYFKDSLDAVNSDIIIADIALGLVV